MKKLICFVSLMTFCGVAQAAIFENTNFDQQDPAYLKSMVVDQKGCEGEGVTVKFYGTSSDYQFCQGYEEVTEHKYKKCIGREVGGFPFGRRCIGMRKTVTEITKKTALVEGAKMIRTQTTHRDGELIHQEQMVLEIDGDQALLETSFINNDWNGSGQERYLFTKKDL